MMNEDVWAIERTLKSCQIICLKKKYLGDFLEVVVIYFGNKENSEFKLLLSYGSLLLGNNFESEPSDINLVWFSYYHFVQL